MRHTTVATRSSYPDVLTGIACFWSFVILALVRGLVSEDESAFWTASGFILSVTAAAACVREKRIEFSDQATYLLAGFAMTYLAIGLWDVGSFDFSKTSKGEWLYRSSISLLSCAAYYALGRAMAVSRVHKVVLASLVVLCITVVAFSSHLSMQGMQELRQINIRVGYQYLGDAIAICTLILLGFQQSAKKAALILLIATPGLLITPSRSSAIIGLAVIFIFAFRQNRMAIRTIALASAAILLFLLSVDAVLPLFEGTRIGETIARRGANSDALRSAVASVGWHVIAENPLLGQWGFQIDHFGLVGLYWHSFMDIWAQTGVIPFALFVSAIFLIIKSSLEFNRKQSGSQHWDPLPLLAFSIVSWAISRNPQHAVLYVALGYAWGAARNKKFRVD